MCPISCRYGWLTCDKIFRAPVLSSAGAGIRDREEGSVSYKRRGGLGLLGVPVSRGCRKRCRRENCLSREGELWPHGCPVCVRLSSFLMASLQAQPGTLCLSEIKLGVAMRAVIPALGETEVARS